MTDYTYSRAAGNMPLNADLDGNPVPANTNYTAFDCACVYSCADDPTERCSLSGEWHVHPGEPCPVHPEAPGDH